MSGIPLEKSGPADKALGGLSKGRQGFRMRKLEGGGEAPGQLRLRLRQNLQPLLWTGEELVCLEEGMTHKGGHRQGSNLSGVGGVFIVEIEGVFDLGRGGVSVSKQGVG